ncbi:hypothetical protein QE435_004086 [Rhizobium sp. SORGH_AS 787]|nr:hypothetical protein [Rhizobium sp. SORGH_AS_0787]
MSVPIGALHTVLPHNLPPSARTGLSCQAGLLTWLLLPVTAFPIAQWLMATGIRLTALGTLRSCTAFPILLPKQAPDDVAYGQLPIGRQARYVYPTGKYRT